MREARSLAGRILFIDDDPAGREVALFNLRKAGYDVTAAEDGAQGLSAFAASPFDLVITDLKMPGVPGMEVLRKIHAGSPDVPSSSSPPSETSRPPWRR